jgi:hypothetical protein
MRTDEQRAADARYKAKQRGLGARNVTVRFTPFERKRLEELMAQLGVSQSQVIKQAVAKLAAEQEKAGPLHPRRVAGSTPGCDCEQNDNPDAGWHASDCNWRVAEQEKVS